MPDAPLREERHRPLQQALGDAPLPQVGPHRERTEEREAAPARREIRSDQLAIQLRRERRRWVGLPATPSILRVARERQRFRQAKEGAESEPPDPLSVFEVGFLERADREAGRHTRCSNTGACVLSVARGCAHPQAWFTPPPPRRELRPPADVVLAIEQPARAIAYAFDHARVDGVADE